MHTIPGTVGSVRLRLDVVSIGKGDRPIVWSGSRYGLDAAFRQSAVRRGVPELLFRATFDDTAEADLAHGEKTPIQAEGVEFVQGHRGRAVRLSAAKKSRLAYPTRGNINPQMGTLAFWFKAEWPEANPGWRGKGVRNRDEIWRSFFHAPSAGPLTGGGTLHFWMWGPKSRLDRHDLDNHIAYGCYVPSSEWRFVVITWDDYGTHMYVDGIAPRKSDSYSPQRQALKMPNPLEFDRAPEMFKAFYVGGEASGRHQVDGLIDDFRIWSQAMSEAQVRRLCDAERDVELETSKSFASEGFRQKVSVSVTSPCGRDLTGARIILVDAGGRERWSSSPLAKEGGKATASLCLPRGEYRFHVAVGDRLFGDEPYGVLSADNPSVCPAGSRDGVPVAMRLVKSILPDPAKLGPETFRAIGVCHTGFLGGRRYLEAGSEAGDRFAVRLTLPGSAPLYCIEMDYPDDTNRTADVIVQRSKGGGEYTLQVGYYCGGEIPNSGRMLTRRCLYWAKDRDVALIVMTARRNSPAAIGEIRVYEVDGEALPAADIKVAAPVDGQVRHFGSYWEDPSVGLDFSTDVSTFEGFEKVVDRMAAVLRYSGRDMFVYPGSWYHGLIGRSYQPRRHPFRFLQAYYEKFGRQGLSVIPTINQQTVPFSDATVSVGTMRDGSLHETAICIHDTGLPNWGGWHGTPPNFCIFHSDVRHEVERTVDVLIAEGRDYPAFKGVCFHLTPINCLWWGGIEAGYNDYVIRSFSQETGILVPVDRHDPLRAKTAAAWLKANAYEAWVKWRCDFMTGFYAGIARKLAEVRPDLVLYLNAMPRENSVCALREAGIDPKGLSEAIPNLVMGTAVYPAGWRHLGLENRFAGPARADYYSLFGPARYPWLNLHDDYWESPIGSSGGRNTLSCDWLKECGWRVTCLNAAGRQAMRPYALALKFNDVLGFSRGGFLVGSYGMEPEMVEFARAFRRLPAVKFDDAPSSNPDVTFRTKTVDGRVHWYAVNTTDRAQSATVRFPGRRNGFTLALEPWQLKSGVR